MYVYRYVTSFFSQMLRALVFSSCATPPGTSRMGHLYLVRICSSYLTAVLLQCTATHGNLKISVQVVSYCHVLKWIVLHRCTLYCFTICCMYSTVLYCTLLCRTGCTTNGSSPYITAIYCCCALMHSPLLSIFSSYSPLPPFTCLLYTSPSPRDQA